MAAKAKKKTVSRTSASAKSKAPAKGRKVGKTSAVKKAPAKTRVTKAGSVTLAPKAAKAKVQKAGKAKVQKVAQGVGSNTTKIVTSKKGPSSARKGALKKILLAKRTALIQQMQAQLGQSLTDEQQRRLEAAMDSGDQALVDLDREMGISLQEMRNRERQMIDDALASLEEGTYGHCAECDVEISEKRLEALPFARYCIECQSRIELIQKIEKGEQRS